MCCVAFTQKDGKNVLDGKNKMDFENYFPFFLPSQPTKFVSEHSGFSISREEDELVSESEAQVNNEANRREISFGSSCQEG